ncbi:hypothetical protein sce6020 [Sorangium cellulosum So ce56]|uniref:Uncharacterized protein n=1 Tax=Sorangium cellulosum (strain So ce56) TaxID=448385 RepID=A9GCG3_SORC5|nr:hypothetical protein sce6020 [Sorangium cellulosum So ce56]
MRARSVPRYPGLFASRRARRFVADVPLGAPARAGDGSRSQESSTNGPIPEAHPLERTEGAQGGTLDVVPAFSAPPAAIMAIGESRPTWDEREKGARGQPPLAASSLALHTDRAALDVRESAQGSVVQRQAAILTKTLCVPHLLVGGSAMSDSKKENSAPKELDVMMKELRNAIDDLSTRLDDMATATPASYNCSCGGCGGCGCGGCGGCRCGGCRCGGCRCGGCGRCRCS